MLDTIDQAINSAGSTWLKIGSVADGRVTGEILDVDERQRTDPEGNVVLTRSGKNAGKPRIEWVVTLKVAERTDADDDGVRKLALNEGGRIAFIDAVREARKTTPDAPLVGATLTFGVKVDRESEYKQPTYGAKFVPGAPKPAASIEDAIGAAPAEDPF